MNVAARAMEIVESMKSFQKATYHKSEILPELLALQQELVAITFNEEHAENANLKIWDVEKHLKQLNEECEGVVSKELEHFEAECKDVCNLIKAEISGNIGERKTFKKLESLRTPHITLTNISLREGEKRTELDAVVITRKGIFIVEVKNTAKDVFIDEGGDYYRTGEYLKLDSSLGIKMEMKEQLLRWALRKTEYEQIPIQRIVIFTNNRIEVKNKYTGFRVCFLSQLNHLIDEWNGKYVLADAEAEKVAREIEQAKCEEAFPMEMDMLQFKKDFAKVMARLEEANEMEAQTINEVENLPAQNERKEDVRESIDLSNHKNKEMLQNLFLIRNYATASMIAATFVISFASVLSIMRHTI